MREAKLGRYRLPGTTEAARTVGFRGDGVHCVEQAVRRVRQGEPFGAGPLGDQSGRQVGRKTPWKLGIGFGLSPQVGCGIDENHTWRGGDGVAVVMALEERRLRKGLAWAGPVQHEATPLSGGTNELKRAFLNDD